VVLLRFGLDDTNAGVRGAAISALSALLAHSALEVGLSAAYPWGETLRPGVGYPYVGTGYFSSSNIEKVI